MLLYDDKHAMSFLSGNLLHEIRRSGSRLVVELQMEVQEHSLNFYSIAPHETFHVSTAGSRMLNNLTLEALYANALSTKPAK